MPPKLKKQYMQVFLDVYAKDFPCMIKSGKGINFAFCSICRCDINIGHGGRSDINAHLKCAKHVSNIMSKETSSKFLDYFARNEKSDSAVINAECLFTSFLVEHNIPLSVSDHAGPLFRKMFPNSETAKRYGCGRTKSTAIMQEMAASATEDIISLLQSVPFSIATDGSNDSNSKLYPLVITFYDEHLKSVVSKLLSLPVLKGDATGRNIGNLVISELEHLNVPLTHLLAFSADNASVMLGSKNGAASVLREKQEALIVVGCPCHLINLAAEKAAAGLPCNVHDILIDVYYYLEKSSKRKEKLQKFQMLHNKEARKILKHVCTRWLSLGKGLLRFVDQWDPLLSVFKDEVTVQKSDSSLQTYKIPKQSTSAAPKIPTSSTQVSPFLVATSSKTVGLCSSDVRKSDNEKEIKSKSTEASRSKSGLCAKKRETQDISTSFGKKRKLDSDKESLTHSSPGNAKQSLKNINSNITREEKIFMFLSSPLNKAICYFLLHVTPSFDKVNVILQSATPQIHVVRKLLCGLLQELLSKFVKPVAIKNKQFHEVKYHLPGNQLENSEIVVGCQTSRVVDMLSEADKIIFFTSVKKYLIIACDYMLHKFPLNEEVLQKAEVVDVDRIERASFSDIKFFLEKFSFILPVKENESNDCAIDELQKQFISLQLEDVSSIINKEDRIDAKWVKLSSVVGADGLPKYDRLAKVMLSVLSVPHSNAECERVFSLVTKNRTKFRPQLSDKSLESLLVMKCNKSGVCYEQKFSDDFLQKAKKATAASLKKQ